MRISGLYEARRKNAQLTRYRIQQALNVKLVSVLERAREAFRMHARIQASARHIYIGRRIGKVEEKSRES